MISTKLDEILPVYWQIEPGDWIENPKNIVPYEVLYHINDDGLRENTNYLVKKPKDTYRIMALGDSFTFGSHVNVEDIWPEKLEQSFLYFENNCGYKNFEVINLGVGGFDIAGIVKRYGEIGEKYNPDLNIWFESGSGFHRDRSLLHSITTECIKSASIYGKEEDVVTQCHLEAQNQLFKDYSLRELFDFAKKDYEKYFNINNTENTIIFYMDSMHYSDQINDFRNTYPSTPFLPIAKNITEEGMLPDGHPSKIGHKIIAESIFDYLKEENIICN